LIESQNGRILNNKEIKEMLNEVAPSFENIKKFNFVVEYPSKNVDVVTL
jgi:hypothetical protein